MLEEGWYLMSLADLERELKRFRAGSGPGGEHVERLTTEQALAYRDAGNIPDERGRSLRLVLHVLTEADLRSLEDKRRRFEPDYLGAPEWRRAGSVPVNVVPLRAAEVTGDPRPWWEDERIAPLEEEWRRSGRVRGIAVPADDRGFVLKAVLALEADRRAVTVDSVCDAIARWLSRQQVETIRASLRAANANEPRR